MGDLADIASAVKEFVKAYSTGNVQGIVKPSSYPFNA